MKIYKNCNFFFIYLAPLKLVRHVDMAKNIIKLILLGLVIAIRHNLLLQEIRVF